MSQSVVHKITGAERINSPLAKLFILLGITALGMVVRKMGIMGVGGLMVLPIGIWFTARMFFNPRFALAMSLFMAFFTSGVSRYINAPWGLTVDFFLLIGWLGFLFRDFKKTNWAPIRNDMSLLALVWFGYLVFQIVNPEAKSFVAWFYAMRGIGFYQLLGFTLVFLVYRHPKFLDRFLVVITVYSILGTLWGLRQMIFGIDAAEHHWLYVEEHADQHILHGVLRVFSFYTDAGQFGASQAMMAFLCGVIAIGPVSVKTKVFYGIAALVTFIGFGISGTRGALAVPVAGAILYLLVSKNFKVLIAGLVTMGIVFYLLKYTFVLQGVEQVRRMRTALDPKDASLQVRLENQRAFGRYLATRPFGGGVGSAGFWGARFSPGSVLATIPTDSWYVKIWAELGLVGICLHLFFFGFVLGKGGNIIWHLEHGVLKYKIMALYGSTGGVMLASYGNQIFGSMPTGMIMNIAIPMIMMAPHYEKILFEEEN